MRLTKAATAVIATAGLAASVDAGVFNAGIAGATTSNAPIIVGSDGDLATSAGVAQGFIAGIYRFNKAGGLNGRKIKFTGFLDDGFSPATNLSNAQKLVENQHVFAVAPFIGQVAGAATGAFLASSKVPS